MIYIVSQKVIQVLHLSVYLCQFKSSTVNLLHLQQFVCLNPVVASVTEILFSTNQTHCHHHRHHHDHCRFMLFSMFSTFWLQLFCFLVKTKRQWNIVEFVLCSFVVVVPLAAVAVDNIGGFWYWFAAGNTTKLSSLMLLATSILRK